VPETELELNLRRG